MARRVVVVPAGEGACWPEGLEADEVVAVDGGLDVCMALGIRPDRWVGDGDSASEAAFTWAGALPREQHPTAKDASDLELALACEGEITVIGGFGGRLDHLLVNAAVLCRRAHRWVGAGVEVWFVRDHAEVPLCAGETFTLLPWGGEAMVSLTGARWPLQSRSLSPFSSLGLSNEAEGPVQVTVFSGVLLVICADRSGAS